MKSISRHIILAIVTVGAAVTCGCSGGSNTSRTSAGAPCDTLKMEYAKHITIVEYDDYTEVKVRNPWDTTKLLGHYALVERDSQVKSEIPKGITKLEIPLQCPVVYSGVHVALIDELGHLDAVKGICDSQYLFEPRYKELVKEGKIADCGNNVSPDLERIFSLAPDAVLLSPYEDSYGDEKLAKARIPVVECADYMESTPLGRAEWMRFYGRLFGESEKADSLFSETKKSYEGLKAKALAAKTKPSIMFDRIYSGVWYVPERLSTTGRFIEDAGGTNLFAYINKPGSGGLTSEEVLIKAGDADFWFIRHAGENINYSSLEKENPVYGKFKPFVNKKVYITDTSRSHVFEDAAFHPQWLLADMIFILHPELGIERVNTYYSPM